MKTKGKIMLIDDSSTNNLLYESIFDSEGYEVVICEDAKAGLKKLKKENPNLIVLDLMMPKMDGFDFLEKMHEDPENLKIPVIILTAKVDKSSERKAYEMGVTDYMIKPVGITQITEKVNAIFEQLNAK